MSLHVQNKQFKQSHIISAKRLGVGVGVGVGVSASSLRHLSSLLDLQLSDAERRDILLENRGKRDWKKKMSKRNGPKVDLKLNLSPPRMPRNTLVESPSRSLTASPVSPPSSCVSSERNPDESPRYASSPEATSMMLVGCPRCLMYVMLAEEDPRCPKCKSTVLLDVIPDSTTLNNTERNTKKS
ncbi:protein GL2-INTERACTING REPRESSOR 1-like [Henckelia pumila]|uniref:protein GL2-INTERACTING REPRESSOR 1-like n=1 Tax=Henckelia pumila TaxID=405737 RepID=UPI003C6DE5DD